MRVLLKVTIPTETGNARIADGSLPRTIESILAEQKPEAAYFIEENGRRTGIVVLQLTDISQLPAIFEPYSLAFGATVEVHPAMTIDDLKKAGPGIQRAVSNFATARV